MMATPEHPQPESSKRGYLGENARGVAILYAARDTLGCSQSAMRCDKLLLLSPVTAGPFHMTFMERKIIRLALAAQLLAYKKRNTESGVGVAYMPVVGEDHSWRPMATQSEHHGCNR